MTYSFLLLSCLILLPIAAQLRGNSPFALFAVVAVTYALFGLFALIHTRTVVIGTQGHGPTFLETYYVVSRAHMPLNLSGVMAVFAAIIWLQDRFSEIVFPKITKALFWILHLSLLGSSAFLVNVLEIFRLRPRTYASYPYFLETLASISSVATFGTAFSALTLLGLTLWSAYKRSG